MNVGETVFVVVFVALVIFLAVMAVMTDINALRKDEERQRKLDYIREHGDIFGVK